MCKGGFEDNCDFCAHEVDFDKSLAVFAGPRADIVKITWDTEALDASSAEAAIRQCSRLVGSVHGKGDRCERETAFESKTAQLRPWCKNIGGILLVAGAHFAEGAALGEDSSAELDAARGYNLPEDVTALEGSIFKTDD